MSFECSNCHLGTVPRRALDVAMIGAICDACDSRNALLELFARDLCEECFWWWLALLVGHCMM